MDVGIQTGISAFESLSTMITIVFADVKIVCTLIGKYIMKNSTFWISGKKYNNLLCVGPEKEVKGPAKLIGGNQRVISAFS